MSYERLTPLRRTILDFIMRGDFSPRDYIRSIAKFRGIARRTAKAHMAEIFHAYQIDSRRYNNRVRLVYLRSKELGLIG